MDLPDKLSTFESKYKRKPRVLHIGNIANNAYNNAKLLNELGFDCDVICPNYYHIMGCPEWEDALIDGDVEDQFRPDWTSVNLNGFERPRWFVQGPLELSIKYLVAKRSGNIHSSDKYWQILSCINYTVKPDLRQKLQFIFWNAKGFFERLSRYIFNPRHLVKRVLIRFKLDKYSTYDKARLFFIKTSRKLFKLFKLIIEKFNIQPVNNEKGIKLCDKIKNDQVKLFGRINTDIGLLSISYYLKQLETWKKLFSQYDVIQAYAIDPICPYFAEVPYFTFEHGTLRQIPFDGTITGTLTALAYANAEHVFVTNTDCIQNAKRLAEDRFSVIPHPFDERRMDNISGWQELKQDLLSSLNVDYLIFFPTRHDWIKDQGFADKANDLMIRAFARLRNDGYNVGLICCKWGHNVDESIKLINELGCSKYIVWYEPMCVVRYEQMLKACDIVADQFLLGAFGGVTFRGLAAGRPVCTYLNNQEVIAAYGEVPPVVNCHTEDEIINSLSELFDQPERIAEIGKASAEWIKNYHSGLMTAKIQGEQYMALLDRQGLKSSIDSGLLGNHRTETV